MTQLPSEEQEYFDQAAAAGGASTSHIYFKDLKLLANDDGLDSDDEEHAAVDDQEVGVGAEAGGEEEGDGNSLWPPGAPPRAASISLDRLGSGGCWVLAERGGTLLIVGGTDCCCCLVACSHFARCTGIGSCGLPPPTLPPPTLPALPLPRTLPIAARGGAGGSGKRRKRVELQKLIVILVGLPARGKTFLCNKLMCYLNWWVGGGGGGGRCVWCAGG